MSRNGGKDKDEGGGNGEKERPHHTGSNVSEDERLTLALRKIWASGEVIERVELWQKFGRNLAVRGEMIHHDDFKPNEKLDVEHANKVANEIMEAAQNDADVRRRAATFDVVIIDRHRKSHPLVRPLGPIEPKRVYASDFDDDDERNPDARSLNIAMIREGLEESRWDKQRNDKITGELFLFLEGTIRRQEALITHQFGQLASFFDKLQEAQDRSLDREVVREKERFKISLWKDGMRTARNLLPALFEGTEAGKSTKQLGDGAEDASREGARHDGSSGGNGANGNGHKRHGKSPERTLVDNFLHDIEQDDALAVALFGDYEARDGKLYQVKPGIFSEAQFRILVNVRKGYLPAAALDPLMPQSGADVMITADQIRAAQDAGVTDGMGHAIFELVGLRNRAKQSGDDAAKGE